MKLKHKKYFGLSIDQISSGALDVMAYLERNEMDFPEWLSPDMSGWPRLKGSLYYHEVGGYRQKVVSTFQFYGTTRDFGEATMFIINELEGQWWWIVDGEYWGQIGFELEDDAMAYKLRFM